MRKILTVTGVIAVCALLAVVLYKQVNAVPENSILAKNIDALTSNEGEHSYNPCPDPYDVYNYKLSFPQHTGYFPVDANGEITIAGKKFKVGGASIGGKVSVTYHISECDDPASGNCCPNSRNGEVKIIGF